MFGDNADIWVGRQYGPYSITELLGRGTVAHVYRAGLRDGSEVALILNVGKFYIQTAQKSNQQIIIEMLNKIMIHQ